MTRALSLSTLAVRSLRNLVHVELEPGRRFNVIAGDNGQGKSNLLEAVYLVATSKSFRTPRLHDVIRHGDGSASVKGGFSDGEDRRVQSVGVEAGKRHLRIDGKRPQSLVAYAIRSPAVVFHPGEMALSMGAGGERRSLLDRVSLYLAAGSPSESADYTRSVRERQRALEARGDRASDLDHWEEIIVRHGLAIMVRRREAAEKVAPVAKLAFEQIAAPGTPLDVAYAPGAPEDALRYRDSLRAHRLMDTRRGAARIGPHRDDLVLSIAGRPARGVASQGQHRALVLALKSAEVDVVAMARGVRPLLLLDDVSSELDSSRTAALFAFLQRHLGQVFLTTTRPDLIDTGSIAGDDSRVDFRVSEGVVERA